MWLFAKIRHWFSLQGNVSREEYVIAGVGLMLLKYVVEAGVIGYITGKFYSPLDFINPLLSARSQFTVGAPEWFGFAWVLWTVLFVWIAVTMSMRRSVDAGASPWAAMLILVPIVNFVTMLYLACIPQDYAKREYHPRQPAKSTPMLDYSDDEHIRNVLGLHATFVGTAVGFCYMFAMVFLSVYLFESYGAALFYGTPIIAGAASGYSYNRWCPRSIASTTGLSVFTGAFFAAGLLLLGLEGMVCLAMAAPIMLPMGLLGALVGRAVAIERQKTSSKEGPRPLGMSARTSFPRRIRTARHPSA